MTGRPTLYSDEIAAEICRRLAEGESLRKICADEAVPSRDTVRNWLNERPDFLGQYARARDAQADDYAERVVDEALSASDAALGRLKMDALKWAASKLAPKKYGDTAKFEADMNLNIAIKQFTPPPDGDR